MGGGGGRPLLTCNTLVKKHTVAKATLTTRNSFWLTEGSVPAAAAEEEEVEATDAAAAVEETSLMSAVVMVDMMDGAPSSPDIVLCDAVRLARL